MDGESGELTEWEEVVGAWTGRTETEGPEWGRRRELGSWFQRQGEAYRKERSVIRSEDGVGGRARVTRDEERMQKYPKTYYITGRSRRPGPCSTVNGFHYTTHITPSTGSVLEYCTGQAAHRHGPGRASEIMLQIAPGQKFNGPVRAV